jgi:cobalt-zinc-cadmium efflux system membrane fusion protein
MKDLFATNLLLLIVGAVFLTGCGAKAQTDPAAGSPPPVQVQKESNDNIFKVDKPSQFLLATAEQHSTSAELKVTGTVSPDVSKAIPVISVAAGRIVEIHARIGDSVKKGQLLFKVQSQDISQAFSDYRQALADEKLAKTQLERSKLLYDRGAIAQKELEVAEETAEKFTVAVETAADHLKVLGADMKSPTALVNVYAPTSGVVTDQQITLAAGTQGLASPNPMTISDLSRVWILCDVYENDMSFVHLGEFADIHLNAYPDMAIRGRINNIGAVLDPNIRTTKVRLEVENPRGILRPGMFAGAVFHSQQVVTRAVVPATAILHLHDRDWVYVPMEGGGFKRVEVVAGNMLADNKQEVNGIQPGQQVVQKALALDSAAQ